MVGVNLASIYHIDYNLTAMPITSFSNLHQKKYRPPRNSGRSMALMLLDMRKGLCFEWKTGCHYS
jgi:hypothetical protein